MTKITQLTMSTILRPRPLIQTTSIQLSLPVKLHLPKDDTSWAKHFLSNSSVYLSSQSLTPWRVGRDRPFRAHAFSPSTSDTEESKWCCGSSSTNAPHELGIFLVVISSYFISKETLERRNHLISCGGKGRKKDMRREIHFT